MQVSRSQTGLSNSSTIFALFQTASRLSREEFKERLISHTLLELLPEPKQELASMKTLDLSTRLADGNRALPLMAEILRIVRQVFDGAQRYGEAWQTGARHGSPASA